MRESVSVMNVDGMTSSSTGLNGPHGDYQLIARIGSGGMASVSLALAPLPDAASRLVVLKVLHPALADDSDIRAMFREEARLAAQLVHPNIVRTYEYAQHADSHFIAMEYLDGQALAKVLKKAPPAGVPMAAVLRITSDVCEGLHYAHSLCSDDGHPLSIVHRDVSPQNIFVTYDGDVKLVDFGIAKAATRSIETQVGVLKGKLSYMSPEQAQGHEVDARADVFSLGVVLFEALVRGRLWGDNATDLFIFRKLLSSDIPSSPRAIVPDLPEVIDRICCRALAANPDDRFQSALEMQQAIEAAVHELGAEISRAELGELVARDFAQERQAIAAALNRKLIAGIAVEEDACVTKLVGRKPAAAAASERALDPLTSATPSADKISPTAPDLFDWPAESKLSERSIWIWADTTTKVDPGSVEAASELASSLRAAQSSAESVLPLSLRATETAAASEQECLDTTRPSVQLAPRSRRHWPRIAALFAGLPILLALGATVTHVRRPSTVSTVSVSATTRPMPSESRLTPASGAQYRIVDEPTVRELAGEPETVPTSNTSAQHASESLRRLRRAAQTAKVPGADSAAGADCSAILSPQQRLLKCGALNDRK